MALPRHLPLLFLATPLLLASAAASSRDEDLDYIIDNADDVVLLTAANFSSFLDERRHAMVEFYAPWCGHCRALAPDYTAAAAQQYDVALAKVDGTEEAELAEQYGVQGFPTLLFFIDGVHKEYHGDRTKKIDEKVAASGYFVVVPYFFHGDPFTPENADRPFPEWIKEHAPAKAFAEAKPNIAALKEQGLSSVGVACYCWGAKIVAELSKANEIQTAVMSHPSFVTIDDIKEVKCPIAVLGAETDRASPPELVKQFEQVLSSNTGIAHFIKIFPGVSHGWTAVKSAEEALVDITGAS